MKKTSNAFTMAEILISLTIIGVIAALTLPALMANLNEKVWNTQRKALHSRMAQALAAMPRLDGYQDTNEGSAAYNFVLNGLSTALNITKVCKPEKMDKCDFAFHQYTVNGEDNPKPDNDCVSFNTVNGESIGVHYRSSCTGASSADFMSGVVNRTICANFFYDLNGASKGPNKIGKDMGFITAFFPEYPIVVAPMPVAATETEIGSEEVEGILAENAEYRLPSIFETIALSDNGTRIGEAYQGGLIPFWTDNNVTCSAKTCTKVTIQNGKSTKAGGDSAYLILVSKNGDAPRTFKTLGNSSGNDEKCSKENPDACKSKEDCDSAGGFWNAMVKPPVCSFKSLKI